MKMGNGHYKPFPFNHLRLIFQLLLLIVLSKMPFYLH